MHAQHIDFLDLLDGQVQYVVPRWQRRYRWGQADIERLVEDLLTVAVAGPDAGKWTSNRRSGPSRADSSSGHSQSTRCLFRLP